MKTSTAILLCSLFAASVFAASFAVDELHGAYASVDDAIHHLDDANAHHAHQFGGHEGRARDLLVQAQKEIYEADGFYTSHPH